MRCRERSPKSLKISLRDTWMVPYLNRICESSAYEVWEKKLHFPFKKKLVWIPLPLGRSSIFIQMALKQRKYLIKPARNPFISHSIALNNGLRQFFFFSCIFNFGDTIYSTRAIIICSLLQMALDYKPLNCLSARQYICHCINWNIVKSDSKKLGQHCDFSMNFLANSYLIFQISHANTFGMRYMY